MKTLLKPSENQQKIFITLTSDVKENVSKFDRQTLQQAYLKLFAGLSRVNWSEQKTLGRSWQSALNLCEVFLAVKSKRVPNNPALKYLSAIHKSYKKYWSKIIMFHQGRDTIINQPKNQRIELARNGTKMANDAINTINLILSRYNTHILEQFAEQTQSYNRPQPGQAPTQKNQPDPQGPTPQQPQPTMAARQVEQAHQAAPMAQPRTQMTQALPVTPQKTVAQERVNRDQKAQKLTEIQHRERAAQSPQPINTQNTKPAQTTATPATRPAQAARGNIVDLRPKFAAATQRVSAKIQFQVQRKIQMSVFQRINQNYKVA